MERDEHPSQDVMVTDWKGDSLYMAMDVTRCGRRLGVLVLRASESDVETGRMHFEGMSLFTAEELEGTSDAVR